MARCFSLVARILNHCIRGNQVRKDDELLAPCVRVMSTFAGQLLVLRQSLDALYWLLKESVKSRSIYHKVWILQLVLTPRVLTRA